jgi:preprotein translocase subunit YajC
MVNEMGVPVWISLAIFAIVLVVGIIAKLVLRKNRRREKQRKSIIKPFL